MDAQDIMAAQFAALSFFTPLFRQASLSPFLIFLCHLYLDLDLVDGHREITIAKLCKKKPRNKLRGV